VQFGRRTEASATARLLRPDTEESFEPRRNDVGGDWGGKAADQGETFPLRHAPDTERDWACPTSGRGCGQALRL